MKHSSKVIGLVVAAAVALVPATASQASAKDVPAVTQVVDATPTTSKVDGQEIFRGLFFGQGDVASNLSEDPNFLGIKEGMSANNSPDAIAASEVLLTQIDEHNGSFFEEFSEQARSGNPRQVKAALADGVAALEGAGITLEEQEVSPDCWVTVFVGAALVHAAAVVTAAGFAVTVVAVAGANVFYATNWVKGKNSNSNNELSLDQSVADLTRSLAAA